MCSLGLLEMQQKFALLPPGQAGFLQCSLDWRAVGEKQLKFPVAPTKRWVDTSQSIFFPEGISFTKSCPPKEFVPFKIFNE